MDTRECNTNACTYSVIREMVVKKESKKGELIQLRVEKPFLDQLNAIATEQHLTLSVMLRAWLAERLKVEEKRLNESRQEWIDSRINQIKKGGMGFEPGSILVAHAYSKLEQNKISMEKIEQNVEFLVPGWYRTPVRKTINQFGLEISRTVSDGKTVMRGAALKSGQLEVVMDIPTVDNQILGKALDYEIVEITQCLCQYLRTQAIEMPYMVHFSLLDVIDKALVVNPVSYSSHSLPHFSQNEIRLSTIEITAPEQFSTEAQTAEHIIDVLDELWNATGQKYSLSFDNNKNWIARPRRL